MDKVYTDSEVAALLKVPRRTVTKWFDSGRLKGFRSPEPPCHRLILRDDLVAFLHSNSMTIPDNLVPGVVLT